ncbi:MAG: hypothetical protein KGH71_00570 [Candidatus Micrarchaeota archaeon]|nr:hypothetical protein [Candidatus Micrarchaeota archaeon]
MNFDAPLFLNSCLSSINGFLSAPITGWFPIAFFGVLAVVFILSLVYMLSPLIGRTDLKTWSRVKIYDTLFAFLLVLIFGGIASMLCTVNPVPTYAGVGLVPNACNPDVVGGDQSINNIFGLAECNLWNFNNSIVNFLNYMIALITFFVSSAPGVTTSASFIPGVSNLGWSVSFGLDASAVKLFFESAAIALGGLILVSQVQLVLLDASMMIFAILLPIGLIARIFGVTRTFGGAMIAFAMGLGFIFPLMISITYGFLGSAIDGFSPLSGIGSAVTGGVEALGSNPGQLLQGTALALFTSGSTNPFQIFYTIFEYIGIGLVGTLLVPIITFTIVNTFILDFSQAVGERMDFFSLLTKVI